MPLARQTIVTRGGDHSVNMQIRDGGPTWGDGWHCWVIRLVVGIDVRLRFELR